MSPTERRWRRAAATAAVLALMLPFVPRAAAESRTDLFADSFDGDLSQWINVGSAVITGGRLRVPTGSEQMRSKPDATAWSDYVFEARVTIENVAAGLVFRAVDSNNFYMWQLSASSGRLRPHKKSGGSYQVLKEVPYPFETGVTYAVKIETDGTTIRTHIDGALVDTSEDHSFSAGSVGFRHGGSETAFYDDIEVYQLVAEPPGLLEPPGSPAGFHGAAAWDGAAAVIELGWQPGPGSPDGYVLERRAEGEVDYSALVSLHGQATGFTDHWADPDRRYDYRLAAFNGAGVSAAVETAARNGRSLPPGYRTWAADYWDVSGGRLPAAAAWDGDADGDGVSNGAEYAFGGDPLTPGAAGKLFLGRAAGLVRLYAEPFAACSDVRYGLWESEDLSKWGKVLGDTSPTFGLLGNLEAGPVLLLESAIGHSPRKWFRWGFSPDPAALAAPENLLVNNLHTEMEVRLTQRQPRFSWAVGGRSQDAFQVLVASDPALLAPGAADLWDSGWVTGDTSIQVPYAGETLESGQIYHWTVRTRQVGVESPFAEPASFETGVLADGYATDAPRVIQTPVAPSAVVRKTTGHFFVDFGRAAFGTITLHVPQPVDGQAVTVHLGEARSDATTVHRNPGGTVRYRQFEIMQQAGQTDYRLTIPTFVPLYSGHIPMPAEVGEVMPFRYVELVNVPDSFVADDIRQLATHVPFDDGAASFVSSDPVLNDVWELCKYSIKATTFTGIYVDGDRERKPYEADAYLNQLCHYYVDRDYVTARRSHEHLLSNPTWPTEWKLHSIFMAWADYEHTGDPRSLEAHYQTLKSKTLLERARADGLLSGNSDDIVDWPAGERDGYDMRSVKTVVSAVHHHALALMARIAEVLGEQDDADEYRQLAARVKDSINDKLWDPVNSRYIDGMTNAGAVSGHASIHANLFPLAFGIVPPERVPGVVDFIKSRGMACSVYPAQYLLEALYKAGEEEHALSLMTSTGLRSWANMIYNVGSTITLEAWDPSFKPNLDWNHAWGAVPANIIPRYILGVRPLEPGFGRMVVRPRPGSLGYASGKVPTIRGAVHVTVHDNRPDRFVMEVDIPPNTTAKVGVPSLGSDATSLRVDGQGTDGTVDGDTVWLEDLPPGRYLIGRGS